MDVSNRRKSRSVYHRGNAGDRRWELAVRLEQLLHERDQVVPVELSGSIRAGVEETPHGLVLLDGVEEELLFDQILVEQRLVESPDCAEQRVRYAEILGRDQVGRGFEFHLEDAAPGVDLDEVLRFLLEAVLVVYRGIQLHFGT